MLLARAYSFRQKSRLAISLSWIGGYTDVVALLAMGTMVSHVTGSMTDLGRSAGAGDLRHVLFYAWLVLTFLSGAMLSAVVTEIGRRRGWRSKYILPIVVEAILLSVLAVGLTHQASTPSRFMLAMIGLGSLAMGLQNATITKISGAVVRTTHLTGIFTDFGLEIVHYLFWLKDRLSGRGWTRASRLMRTSRRHPTAQRALLLASIAGSFGLSAFIGYLAFQRLAASALFVPVAFLVWIVCVGLRRPMADIRKIDRETDPEFKLISVINQLLPSGVVLYRLGSGQRAPNFQLWLQQVPEDCRVVILAMNSQVYFDANAAFDLEEAMQRLHAQGQTLIISGMTTAQVRSLKHFGLAREIGMSNLCPDLEFAIARAIGLVPENAVS